jgi:hypothetical protein
MSEEKTQTSPKVGFLVFWMVFIIVAGSIGLLITSLRVGQQNETTYGRVYKDFVDSWGGEINIIPADFYFEEQYVEKEYNSESRIYVEQTKTRNHYVLPNSIVDLFNNHLNSPVIIYNTANQVHSQ